MNQPTQPNRSTREMETREVRIRPESWTPPQLIPTPDPMPGFALRWIRTETNGEADAANVARAFTEGWEPVQLNEQPKMVSMWRRHEKYSGYNGTIEHGGLMLCKIPEEFMRQREAYYSQATRNAQIAVDNSLMKEQDGRMPLFKESKTKVTFGSGGA